MKIQRASIGKIACLPYAIREQVNQRLLNGQRGPAILPWLNSLKPVQKILADQFKGKPINTQNLSQWRNCGFKRWQEEEKPYLEIGKNSRAGRRYARAAKGLAAGAAAIAANRLFQALTSGEITSTEDLLKMLPAINHLVKADYNQARLKLDKRKVRQKDAQILLARDKHHRDISAVALRVVHDDRVRLIEAANVSYEEKIELVGRHLFGDLWQPRLLSDPNKRPGGPPAASKPAPAGEAGSSRSRGRQSALNETDNATASPAASALDANQSKIENPNSKIPDASVPQPTHDSQGIPLPQITPGKTTQQLIAEIEDYAVEVALARKARSPLAGSSGRQSALNETDNAPASPAASALDANQAKIENPNSKIPKVPLSDYDKALMEGKSHLEALYAQFTPTPEELARRKRANEELRHPAGVPIYEPPTAQQSSTPNPQKIYGPCPSPYTWQGHRPLDNWKVHTS